MSIPPLHAVRIAMADDDPDDRMLAHEAFAECGFVDSVEIVADGDALLSLLRRFAAQGSPPDLVLLDWNMPRRDGREVLADIRADPQLRPLRVVVLTTSRDPADRALARETGASGFLSKPVTFEGLVALFRDVVAHVAPGEDG